MESIPIYYNRQFTHSFFSIDDDQLIKPECIWIVSEFLRELNALKNTDKTSKINLTFIAMIIVTFVIYLFCLFNGLFGETTTFFSYVFLVLVGYVIYYFIHVANLTLLKNKFEGIVDSYSAKLADHYQLIPRVDYSVIVLKKDDETKQAFILAPIQTASNLVDPPLRIQGEIRKEKSFAGGKKNDLLEPLNP